MGRIVVIFDSVIGGDLLEVCPTESADFRGAEERRRSKGVGARSHRCAKQGKGS